MNSTFHLIDQTNGQFYKGTDRTGKPEYAKRGLGKKFTDAGKVKLHLLYLVGAFNPGSRYEALLKSRTEASTGALQSIDRDLRVYEMLNPGYFNGPDWMRNYAPWDAIPNTWQVIENADQFDGTKRLVPVDFDIACFIAQHFRLRALTERFGSAVKDLYKKLETKKKLEDYENLVVVAPDYQSMAYEDVYYDLDEGVSDAARITKILLEMGVRRSEAVRCTVRGTSAIAFESLSQAMHFKFAYDGPLNVVMLDLGSLTEIVGIGPATPAVPDLAQAG